MQDSGECFRLDPTSTGPFYGKVTKVSAAKPAKMGIFYKFLPCEDGSLMS